MRIWEEEAINIHTPSRTLSYFAANQAMPRFQKQLAPDYDWRIDRTCRKIWWQPGPPPTARMELSDFLADFWSTVYYNVAFGLERRGLSQLAAADVSFMKRVRFARADLARFGYEWKPPDNYS